MATCFILALSRPCSGAVCRQLNEECYAGATGSTAGLSHAAGGHSVFGALSAIACIFISPRRDGCREGILNGVNGGTQLTAASREEGQNKACVTIRIACTGMLATQNRGSQERQKKDEQAKSTESTPIQSGHLPHVHTGSGYGGIHGSAARCLRPRQQRISCSQLVQATATLRAKHGVPDTGQPFAAAANRASLVLRMPHTLFPPSEQQAEERWLASTAALRADPS